MWILALYPNYPEWVNNSQLVIILICVGEGFRRAQWALIRIENENINNFEKYRSFLEIPAVKEDEDPLRK